MINPLTPIFNVMGQINRYHTLTQCFDDDLVKQRAEDRRQQCEFENCKTVAQEIDKKLDYIREYIRKPSRSALRKERTPV